MRLSTKDARTIALHAQHLTSLPAQPIDQAKLLQVIEQIGVLQIDTLQRVARSHYVVLWSRVGNYDPALVDALSNEAPRKLFEYWYHAACFVPFKNYRYLRPAMRRENEAEDARNGSGMQVSLQRDTMAQVLERVRAEGGLRTSHFDDPRPERGSWWDWKPAKHALELLYDAGVLMVAGRVKFQRIYDLAERVVPPDVDTTEPTPEETLRHFVEQGAKSLGVCGPYQTGDYSYKRKTAIKPIVQALLSEEILLPIQVELADGKIADWVIHRDNLALVQQVQDEAIQAELTTFLSPFDSLFWAQRRDMQLWQFFQTLEAYVPAPKRRWGYFSLPILYKDRLIGRFDPKLERKARLLRLEHLHLEPTVIPDEAMVTSVAEAMRRFMIYHQADDLVVDHSNPPEFGAALARAVQSL